MHDLKINILIVDDGELLLCALIRTHKRLCPSADVSSVQVATQFKQLINNNALPNIIFCDSMMQLPAGKNVLKQAKEPRLSALRCLLTGDMSGNYLLQLNNEIHFQLVKAFTQPNLKSVINSAAVLNTFPISSEHRVVLGQSSKLPFIVCIAQSLLNALDKCEFSVSILKRCIGYRFLLASVVSHVTNSLIRFNNHKQV